MKKLSIYVGVKSGGEREIFRAFQPPTKETYGHLYGIVIGPFRTVRGAEFMRDHGTGNPHCLTVNDAERLAKESK